MGVGLEWPLVLTLYMLGWKGLRDSKNVSYVDVGLV